MSAYSLTHLPDSVLLRSLSDLVARERDRAAQVVAHIGEVDARKLYLPAGHSSMFAYCVDELRLSEDTAYMRIRAARAAREFPALFTALAAGRLHLTAICLLAPHLTAENADELIAAATHRRKSEIEQWLARRFAALQTPSRAPVLRPMPIKPVRKLVPERVEAASPPANSGKDLLGELVSERAAAPEAREPERFLLNLTLTKATHDKLRRAQALLSHSVPSQDLAQVLDRALDLALAELQRRKFAATARPRPAGCSKRPRHIPAHAKRAVWERDRGRCTYVARSGRRCAAREFLEFDHIDPVARGGQPTVERLRLRCRAHNQHEAERTFGTRFMEGKRRRAPTTAGTTTETLPP